MKNKTWWFFKIINLLPFVISSTSCSHYTTLARIFKSPAASMSFPTRGLTSGANQRRLDAAAVCVNHSKTREKRLANVFPNVSQISSVLNIDWRLMRKATVKVQDTQWRETWQERCHLWSIFNTDKGDFVMWQFSQHEHKSPAHCLVAETFMLLWDIKTHTCSSRIPPGQMSGSVWPLLSPPSHVAWTT